MTAALPMGGQKITGMADPTVSTDGATKNYVDTLTAAFFSTGDGKITLKTVADSGWILCDDGTFGSATSGSSNRANLDTLALFTLFFNNISDTAAPLLTSGGGATTRAAQVSAAAAWAANCRMTLTKQLGRAIAVAGAGAGLTSRPLGSNTGAETAALSSTNQLPQFIPSGNVNLSDTGASNWLSFNHSGALTFAGSGTHALGDLTSLSATFTGNPIGSASPSSFSIVQPESFWNCMIKL